MERDDVSDSELVVLRVVLMHPLARSVAQYADCTGLSIRDTADAAARLAELGLIDWRRHEGYADLRPRLEHELWPELAARVAATPIRWPDTMGVPRDPRLARSDIDDDMSSIGASYSGGDPIASKMSLTMTRAWQPRCCASGCGSTGTRITSWRRVPAQPHCLALGRPVLR